MKSKIDEVIKKSAEMFSYATFSHDEMVISVSDLEQLRPFVELGEETVKWWDWLKDKSNENWDLKKVSKLIQQIKEQKQ